MATLVTAEAMKKAAGVHEPQSKEKSRTTLKGKEAILHALARAADDTSFWPNWLITRAKPLLSITPLHRKRAPLWPAGTSRG